MKNIITFSNQGAAAQQVSNDTIFIVPCTNEKSQAMYEFTASTESKT